MIARFAVLAVTLGAATVSAQAPMLTGQQSGTTATLIGVSAVSPDTVWLSGQQGTVLRTTNGGDHWEVHRVPGAERLEFRDVHAASATEAWVLSIGNGPSSRIYHTTDAGQTWTLQFENADSAAFYDCFTFFDAKTAVTFGDAVNGRTMMLRTEDGGEHWSLLPAEALPAALEGEGGFAASGGCVTSIDRTHGWVATTEARVFRTSDAGKSWSVATAPLAHGNGTGMTSTSWRDARRGIAVGGTSGRTRNTDTTSAAIAFTSDGGQTWTLARRPPPGSPFGVSWLRGTDRIVIASPGGAMVSQDAGKTWTALDTNQYWSVGSAGKRAWVVGVGGRITRLEFR
jgi:photosystem II stability/assembly factor-like uncharacterized protein